MSQGSKSGLRVFADFLNIINDTAIADSTPELQPGGEITIAGTGSALTLATVTDETGGVLSIDVTDDAGDDGYGMYSTFFKPADGAIRFECRFKLLDASAAGFFVGYQETLTVAEPVFPYTLSGTTISIVDTGQVVGLFLDHNGTNDDVHFAASNDAAAANGVDLTNPAINKGWGVGSSGGGRAGVDMSGAVMDDSWMLFVIEIDTDGTGRAYFGSVQNDNDGVGPKLIGQTDRGALDPTALYHPVIFVENDGSTGVTAEHDYYLAESSRDWAVD